MKKPFFTVIIPTYNRALLLKEAINSVLDQTFKDFELIIVDDHSTDNTEEVVKSLHDDRIIYVINDRTKGSAGARNAGIFRAQGEWIAFLDSDDVWLQIKLEKQFNKIQAIDTTIGFIYAGYAVYDFINKKEISTYLPEKEGLIQKELLYSNYITALCSVVIRKDILLRVGGFDESFPALEDWELYVRISGATRFCFLRDKLVYVRKNNHDRLSLNYSRKLSAALLFRKKYDFFIKKSPRLSHRISSIILLWALKLNDWSTAVKHLPWSFAGIFFNPYNFCKTMMGAFLILNKSKKIRL